MISRKLNSTVLWIISGLSHVCSLFHCLHVDTNAFISIESNASVSSDRKREAASYSRSIIITPYFRTVLILWNFYCKRDVPTLMLGAAISN
ncbi:hypothetical protein TNCV_179621 [Trichonephila clavipes]|nr:hypothetical protein TNCV_179621 [Trichonephila clavipes]